MDDKEVNYKFYEWERRAKEQWDAKWEWDQKQFPRTGNEPVLDDTIQYTKEELEKFHEFDRRRYWLSGKKYKRVEEQRLDVIKEELQQREAKRSSVYGSPTKFVTALKVGFETDRPEGMQNSAIYTAAYNKNIEVQIRHIDGKFVVTRIR